MTAKSKRYALVVDSRKCINCKACSVACRAENQVPSGKSRNWLNEEHRGEWPKLIAAFEPEQCHHCAEPACVRVCPTGASMQRPDGVVVVEASDCVGCRYCIIACPYDARFFREDLGVVEKCDFCARRVDRGRRPLVSRSATFAREGWIVGRRPLVSRRVPGASGSSAI